MAGEAKKRLKTVSVPENLTSIFLNAQEYVDRYFQNRDENPEKGLVFDGRVSEDFKLMSGTWVHVGMLRLALIAAAEPVIQDAVITGQDREYLGLLVFPSLPGCGSLCPGADDDTSLEKLVSFPQVRAGLTEKIRAYNSEHPGSSTRIARVLLMTEPPNIDANEITDKGYINQRAVLERRCELVEKLHAAEADDEVILL